MLILLRFVMRIEFGTLHKRAYIEALSKKGKKTKNAALQEQEKSTTVLGRVEESRQQHTIRATSKSEPTMGSSSSVRLVYNMVIPVTEECFESLLPTTSSWREQWERPENSDNNIDHAFPFLNSIISDFSFGKGMQRWHDKIPGFGPCLAFNAKSHPDSLLNETIKNELLNLRFKVAGASYRLQSDGIGFFHGQKGDKKTKQRSQTNSFEPCDPLDPSVQETFKKEANLELKFAVGTDSQDGQSVIVNKQLFHYGEYPQISVTIDVHFSPSLVEGKGASSLEEIQQEIITHITEAFVPFLNKHQEQLTGHKEFKNSSHWRPHPVKPTAVYSPTYAKQQDITTLPNQAPKDEKIPEATTSNKKNITPISATKKPQSSNRSNNMFGGLYFSDSDSDSDSDKAIAPPIPAPKTSRSSNIFSMLGASDSSDSDSDSSNLKL
jgi:hypothetical protein